MGAIAQPSRNLELKAKDGDPARSLGVCQALGAEDRGTLIQRDTYFGVPRGRLKLREEPEAGAHLIAYQRPDLPGQKESRYRILEVGEPAQLLDTLSAALGVRAVVSKTRRLFIFEGVRIHLDSVDGLGDFIELEGVAADGDLRPFEQLLVSLRRSFGIDEADLLPDSYSDMVQRKRWA